MPIYKGQTKIVKLYKGTTQIIKRYKGTDLIYSASRLPAGYQEVEYIECSDSVSSYIDIGITWNNLSKIKTKVQYLDSDASGMLFNNPNRENPYIAVSRTVGLSNFSSNISLSQLTNQQITELEMTFTSTYTTNVITRNWDGVWNNRLRYFYIEFYDNNDTLVRNFIPCYRKSDTEIGLYDLVNDVFYTNAGSGTFIKGNDV